MLWEGQELVEDYTLPGNGLGRVGLLRPVTWQYFYEDAGLVDDATAWSRAVAHGRDRAGISREGESPRVGAPARV
jgi:hypothetical protein